MRSEVSVGFSCSKCGQHDVAYVDLTAEELHDDSPVHHTLAVHLHGCPACGWRSPMRLVEAAGNPLFRGMLVALLPLSIGVELLFVDWNLTGAFVALGVTAALATATALVTRSRIRQLSHRAKAMVSWRGNATSRETAVVERDRLGSKATRGAIDSRTALTAIGITAIWLGLTGQELPVASATFALGVVLLSAAFRGTNHTQRALFALVFSIIAAGVLVATAVYVDGRSEVWNLELLLPAVAGALPGLLVYTVLERKLAPQTLKGLDEL